MINLDLLSQAEKQASLPGAHDILDMDSTGGMLADTLTPASFGGDRAGRATAMAEASGQNVPLSVRHPLLGSVPATLLGGLTGAGLGYGGANLAEADDNTKLIATLLGGTAGAVAGTAGAGMYRRGQMDDISKGYDEAKRHGRVKPKAPDFNTLASILPLHRGPHRLGEVAGVQQMLGQDPHNYARGTGNTIHTLSAASGPVGQAISAALNGGQALYAHGLGSALKNQLGQN